MKHETRPSVATVTPGPKDQFGRVIDYLRLSITDRCNLRCTYCMPLSRADAADTPEVLTAAEIETVVRCAVDVGFRKFRLTGGEPTVRRDVVDIVRRIASVPGVGDLAMTTNALRMPELARPLRDAGLGRVNVHLDSLSATTLPRVMRLGDADRILDGIRACEDAGLTPIKLNAVVVRGMNDVEVADMARLTIERDWHVRFIELMPLGAGDEARLSVTHFVSNVDTRARIESEFGGLEPVAPKSASDESENFRIPGARGVVGFISPVSKPYCGGCNRMRLTADGRFHLCLLHDDDMDVRGALRSGAAEDARLDRVRSILRRAVSAKPTGHRLDAGFHTRGRRMHQIGG
ncbi:MAG: GTP 3',8-cyclase MoaA [Planctomycetes bacterium]|nr:GTP 3',8-cyclase MoaA [Planctomycetota bacterium]